MQAAKKYCEQKQKNKINIIVLDNASSDGSAQMIKTDYPDVKLIASNENTGFSKGNNIVMKDVKTPYILLLNSDVYLEEESLYKCLAYFRVNLNCDALGVRLNYSTGKLQFSAGNLPNPLNLITWILGIANLPIVENVIPPYHPKSKNYFSKAHKVGWVMGAFLMIKKEIFDKTSGFDENLFMYAEEVEWAKRIKNKGYKIWYVPQVQVTHLHGASSNFDLTGSFLKELAGVKYYLRKHFNFFYFPVKLFLILGLILRIIVFSIFFKTKRAKIYLKGLSFI